MEVKSFYRTKMCRRAFVGCFNIDCNYAHDFNECKSDVDYAVAGVDFVESFVVLDSFLPRFIVRFNDDEDDETSPSTMSLSQIAAIQESEEYKKTQEAYLPFRLNQVARQRVFHMVREYAKLTMTQGEQDMEFSDEEMDLE